MSSHSEQEPLVPSPHNNAEKVALNTALVAGVLASALVVTPALYIDARAESLGESVRARFAPPEQGNDL